MKVILAITALALSYFLGGFLGGALTAKIKGIDLQKHGSGSMGATNVLRTLGPASAAATLLIDVAKGALAVLLGRWLGSSAGMFWLQPACGLAAIIGHSWPVSTAFRGGKGVATLLGATLMLAPLEALVCLGIWLLIALPTGFVSLGSIFAMLCMPGAIALLPRKEGELPVLIIYGILAAMVSIYRHRDNIVRLCKGQENNLWRTRKEQL